MVWEENSDGFFLRVRLTPNAAAVAYGGVFVDANQREFLKISVVSVPEKGKANKELVALLARVLRLPKGAFDIVGGQNDRYKKIKIECDDVDRLCEAIQGLVKGDK